MAIPAKRFEFLNGETNVSVSSFSSKLGSGILNSPITTAREAIPSLDELIKTATAEAPLDKSTVDELKRVVKDARATATDIGNLPKEKLDDLVKTISGGDAATGKAIKSILEKCSTKGMGSGLPGKPFDVSMNCGGGDVSLGASGGASNCNASSFSDLLGKLTGGEYNATFKDISSSVNKLMALGSYGLNMGMCGVFTALSEGIPKETLSKAAGVLLAETGGSGNAMGFMDMAKSSVGLTPLLHVPDVVSTAVSNYKSPKNTRQGDLTKMGDRFVGALTLVDEKWDRSKEDGIPSIASAVKRTPDLKKTFAAKLSDRSFDADGIDVPVFDDLDFTMGAFLTDAA